MIKWNKTIALILASLTLVTTVAGYSSASVASEARVSIVESENAMLGVKTYPVSVQTVVEKVVYENSSSDGNQGKGSAKGPDAKKGSGGDSTVDSGRKLDSGSKDKSDGGSGKDRDASGVSEGGSKKAFTVYNRFASPAEVEVSVDEDRDGVVAGSRARTLNVRSGGAEDVYFDFTGKDKQAGEHPVTYVVTAKADGVSAEVTVDADVTSTLRVVEVKKPKPCDKDETGACKKKGDEQQYGQGDKGRGDKENDTAQKGQGEPNSGKEGDGGSAPGQDARSGSGPTSPIGPVLAGDGQSTTGKDNPGSKDEANSGAGGGSAGTDRAGSGAGGGAARAPGQPAQVGG